MKSCFGYTTVAFNGSSLFIRMTKQLNELEAEMGDNIHMYVEEKDGVKRIIIEKGEE